MIRFTFNVLHSQNIVKTLKYQGHKYSKCYL